MAKSRQPDSPIIALLRHLIDEAVAWSHAELGLAREDARRLLRRYLVGLGMLLSGFAIFIAGLITLAQALIGVLADYLQGHVMAGLAVGLATLAVALACLVIARLFFRIPARPQSAVFQRLLRQAARK
jgi:uncharacterized BrkB/YihY/UPF0761 family membrane protein